MQKYLVNAEILLLVHETTSAGASGAWASSLRWSQTLRKPFSGITDWIRWVPWVLLIRIYIYQLLTLSNYTMLHSFDDVKGDDNYTINFFMQLTFQWKLNSFTRWFFCVNFVCTCLFNCSLCRVSSSRLASGAFHAIQTTLAKLGWWKIIVSKHVPVISDKTDGWPK